MKLEEETVQRNTMKVVRLSIHPETSKKSKPGDVSSRAALSLKISAPVCLAKLHSGSSMTSSDAVSRVSVGCPQNRRLDFDVKKTIQRHLDDPSQSVNCEARKESDKKIKKLMKS